MRKAEGALKVEAGATARAPTAAVEAAATTTATAGQASATPRVKTEQPQLPEASSGVAAPSLWWRKGRGRELGSGVRSKVLRLVRTHLAALGGSALPGAGTEPLGAPPSTAPAARASRLHGRQLLCLLALQASRPSCEARSSSRTAPTRASACGAGSSACRAGRRSCCARPLTLTPTLTLTLTLTSTPTLNLNLTLTPTLTLTLTPTRTRTRRSCCARSTRRAIARSSSSSTSRSGGCSAPSSPPGPRDSRSKPRPDSALGRAVLAAPQPTAPASCGPTLPASSHFGLRAARRSWDALLCRSGPQERDAARP